MSFLVSHADGPQVAYDLESAISIHVPPLCCATIPHLERLLHVGVGYQVLLVRTRPMLETNLIIDQGPVEPTEPGERLWTQVFNLSHLRIQVKKGDVLSRLLCVRTT